MSGRSSAAHPSWLTAVAILAVAVTVAWSGALSGGFVWDDEWLILTNPNLAPARLVDLVTQPTAIAGDTNQLAYYRPVLSLSLAADALAWGRRAWGFHLTSLALHLGVGLLLFATARRLLGDRPAAGWAALAAATLFLLVPANVEPVVYVSGRNDSLASIFCLAALWFWLEPDGGLRPALAAGAATLLALFTKEAALLLPAALIGTDLLLRKKTPPRELAIRWGAPLLAAALALAVRGAVLAGRPTRVPSSLGWMAYLATAPAALLQYTGILFWPGARTVHQTAIAPVTSILDLRWLAGLATAGALGALALLLLRREPRSAAPALAFVAAFGVVFPLSFPALSAFEAAFPVCERFLYLGGIGLALAAAIPLRGLIERSATNRRVALLAGVPLLVLAGVWIAGARSRAADWRDDLRLFETLSAGTPESSKIRYQYALALGRRDRTAEATREYEEAIRLSPSNLPARNNLALLYEQAGRTTDAEAQYRACLEIAPAIPLVRHNLATLLQRQGRLAEAEAEYRQAILRDPLHAESHVQLGELLAQSGDMAGAFVSWREAVRVDPSYGPAHARYGAALAQAGQTEDGIREMRLGLELDPDDDRVRSDLAAALTDTGRAEEAVGLLRASLARWPTDPRALYHAGNALRALGRREEAAELYLRALASNPGYARAANNLGVTLTELGRFDEALAAFDRLVAAEPASARAHNNRGVALQRLGREQEARAEFHEALRIDPTYPEPAQHLAGAPAGL